MFACATFFLLLIASLCQGQTKINRLCAPDNVDFNTKVDKSSIVVYGKTMAKIMNEGSDSVFHLSFQVDCILKGPATLRQINITNAGRAPNREYCQEFPVGRGYSIAFLEPVSLNPVDHKTFVPADFVEIINDGTTVDQLLARTCSLHRLVPLNSIATVPEICPSVATDPLCQINVETTATTIAETLEETTSAHKSHNHTNSNDHGHLSKPIQTPQQELLAIRAKSGSSQVDVDQKSAGQTLVFNIFLLTFIALFNFGLN